MGRLIDEKCYLYGSCKCQTAGCIARPDNGCPVYRYFKDLILKDYENRLKADMVAILTDIQLEINEAEMHRYDDQIDKAYNLGLHRGGKIIQEHINVLKENKGNE